MSFRDAILNGTGNVSWSIDLATHLGTKIENETCTPELALPLRRKSVEATYQQKWQKVREPTAGYNCFGHVFALRRTTLYQPNVEIILAEDGFALIAEDDSAPGDVVVYSDEDGPMHVACIVRVETPILVHGEPHARVPIVLSKFDDVSGEYEHKIRDTSWAQGEVTLAVYRSRAQTPRKVAASWRDRIT